MYITYNGILFTYHNDTLKTLAPEMFSVLTRVEPLTDIFIRLSVMRQTGGGFVKSDIVGL